MLKVSGMLLVTCTFLFALNENEVVTQSLTNDVSLQVNKTTLWKNNYSLEAAKGSWIPQFDFKLMQDITPYDTVWQREEISVLNTDYLRHHARTFGEAKLTQAVPGGGVFGVSFDGSYDNIYSSNPSPVAHPWGSNFNINFMQPLLRGAWKYGSTTYEVTIKELESDRINLDVIRQVQQNLSEVRRLYWQWYEMRTKMGFFDLESNFYDTLLASDRVRISEGVISEYDTLTSAFKLAEAQLRFTETENNILIIWQNLARRIGIPDEEYENQSIDTSALYQYTDISSVDDFIAECEQWDPQLQIFTKLEEQLTLESGQSKNDLWPDLNFSAQYNRNNLGHDDLFNGHNMYRSNAIFALILTYSLPTKERRMEKKIREISLAENQLVSDDYRIQLHQQVQRLFTLIENGRKELEIAKRGTEVAQRKFEIARIGYEEGNLSHSQFREAEEDYIRASLATLKKSVELKNIDIALEEVSGRVFSHFSINVGDLAEVQDFETSESLEE